jgi:hypothetical protein
MIHGHMNAKFCSNVLKFASKSEQTIGKSEGSTAGADRGKRKNVFRFAAKTCENNKVTFLGKNLHH